MYDRGSGNAIASEMLAVLHYAGLAHTYGPCPSGPPLSMEEMEVRAMQPLHGNSAHSLARFASGIGHFKPSRSSASGK